MNSHAEESNAGNMCQSYMRMFYACVNDCDKVRKGGSSVSPIVVCAVRLIRVSLAEVQHSGSGFLVNDHIGFI